jgi:heme/copper-type cytochrome/quinol oxidase subunit 2
MRSRLLSLWPFVGLALVILLVPIPFNSTPVTHELSMTADQFSFDPPVLRVKQGDRIRLTLQAADVVHGFYLDGHDIAVRVEPGISRQVEFVADQVGKFRYRCSVSCGTLHPFMIGELVVGPNLVLARSIGLMLVALAAILFYLWCFPPREPGHNL